MTNALEDKYILAMESSCDETAAAVVRNGREVLSSAVYSQTEIHKRFGGVVPEVASRNHTLKINDVAETALREAGLGFEDVGAVAVTYGAGLAGALLVGVSYAKAAAYTLGVPLYAVNHIEGHIAANYITHAALTPPFFCLVASGGHTAIVEKRSYAARRLIGSTLDDAAGEAFDKAARVLGLGYPGGPLLEKAAREGRAVIPFPRADMKDFNFSFSGLKTAVLGYINRTRQKGETVNTADVAASFQSVAAESLTAAAVGACKRYGVKKLCLAGGVSANGVLREEIAKKCEAAGIELFLPETRYCTDNAAMIGAAAYFAAKEGKGLADMTLNAEPGLKLNID